MTGNYKKRIGIDARFMLRPLRGIPLYVTRLCQHLPVLRSNYLFYLFINRGFEHNDLLKNYQSRLESLQGYNNVRIVNVDDDAEIMWEQIYLPRLVKKYKINLLHMPANRICFKSNIPIVVTIHDIMEYLFLSRIVSLPKPASLKMFLYIMRRRFYVWLNYRFGLKRAAKIISVSQYSAKDLRQFLKISHSKIKVIHHGIDEEFFSSSEKVTNLSNSASGLANRSFVLMLGGDSYQKNPEGAIAAWAKVPIAIRKKYPLKVIGFCGNDQSPLIQAVRKHGLNDEVEIKGWVTQKELIDNFRNAVIFLCLSRYEGFGFPLLQAMATGTPVISTNRASLPEVLGDVGFQFNPDDYQGIANAIVRLLQDRYIWDKQSAAGIKRAEMFTWRRCAQEHIRVYEEVLRDK